MAAMAAPFQWSLAALETLMAEDQMDQHAAVLRASPLSVRRPHAQQRNIEEKVYLIVMISVEC